MPSRPDRHRKIADEAGLKLIAYEGDQHVINKARDINCSPVMFELYEQYLGEMFRHFEHFCHYCHLGQAGDRGTWGAIEFTGQSLAEAHKYRALVEWARSNSVGAHLPMSTAAASSR